MKIYTSYFAVENKIPQDVVRLSVARWKPKGVVALEYKKAAPTEKILREWKDGKLTVEQYIKAYEREVLNKLKIEEVLDYFRLIGNGNDIVLLCFEKSEDFCHRHLFAEWLREQGIEVVEYKF